MLRGLQSRARLSIQEFITGEKKAFAWGILATLLVLAIAKPQIIFSHYEQGMKAGFESGYKQGKHDALLTNPMNHELESACLNIWVGNQLQQEKSNAQK